MEDIYRSIAEKDANKMSHIVTSAPDSLFARNHNHETLLSVSIKTDAVDCVAKLLELGGASSIFVHGYSAESLVCTLPMASQPQSSVFKHAEPLTKVNPAVLQLVDEKMSEYVRRMLAEADAEAARKVAAEAEAEVERKRLAASKAPASGGAAAAAAPSGPPFNHFPAQLNPGDIGKKDPSSRARNL